MKRYIINSLLENKFVSGEAIAEKFGVSRNAVWKEITQLRNDGFEIEASTRKGYILKSAPEKLNGYVIAYYTRGSMWKNIEFKHTINSTNTFLKQKEDLQSGDVAIAERQTEGRGRRGRTWYSPEGNIYMSVCIIPEGELEKAPLTGLAAAVAVAEAVSALGVECKIKWPNDIVIDGKKVCGILSEIIGEAEGGFFCIVGIGINTGVSSFNESVINPAVSICDMYKKKLDVNRFTADTLLALEKQLKNKNMLEEYKKYCVNIGRTVKIIGADGEYTAEAVGINENGNLLIKNENGITAVKSGEVSVRGIYGYCD